MFRTLLTFKKLLSTYSIAVSYLTSTEVVLIFSIILALIAYNVFYIFILLLNSYLLSI